jgi:alpha-tubulin suppressor-like RCC1 family protein
MISCGMPTTHRALRWLAPWLALWLGCSNRDPSAAASDAGVAAPPSAAPIATSATAAPPTASAVPSATAAAPAGPLAMAARRLVMNDTDVCVRRAERAWRCSSDTLDAFVRGKKIVDMALGDDHGCFIDEAAHVSCWGSNAHGQLGDGTSMPSDEPRVISDVDKARSIRAKGRRTCALSDGGAVTCWGCSRGDCSGRGRVPERVEDMSDAVAVEVGFHHECALRSAHPMRCWRTRYAEVEYQYVNQDPSVVPALPATSALAIGAAFTCVMDSAGKIRCWGDSGAGALGDGSESRVNPPRGPFRSEALEVTGLDRASWLAAGFEHACAVAADGVPWCWGNIEGGTTPDGAHENITRPTPVAIAGMKDVEEIAAAQRTCALRRSGKVFCWEQARTLKPIEVAVPKG